MRERDLGVRWFNTTFYPQRKTGRAAGLEDGVLPRLREQSITLFTPWGPRYDWESRGVEIEPTHREVETLNALAQIFSDLQENMVGKSWRWIILGADLYGTRINGLPEEVVNAYFISLRQWIGEVVPSVEFCLWSQFDAEAASFREYARRNLQSLVSPKVHERTERVASRMGRGSAEDYIVERLAEALLFEECFRPIKLSAVRRDKDDGVDGPLPRLYFLPEKLQTPWM